MSTRESRELLGLPREKGDPITFPDRNELLEWLGDVGYDLDIAKVKFEALHDYVQDVLKAEWLARSRKYKVEAFNGWLSGDYGITVGMFTDEEWVRLDGLSYIDFKQEALSLYRGRKETWGKIPKGSWKRSKEWMERLENMISYRRECIVKVSGLMKRIKSGDTSEVATWDKPVEHKRIPCIVRVTSREG